jgi:UDP:flavonoid glycosyltransferase YjiC (YdhE family)
MVAAPVTLSHRAPRRVRVLFVGEAVTLAHIARPIALARGLDASHYEVLFACDSTYQSLIGALPFSRERISSISPGAFAEALARGAPIYDETTLRGYVSDELELIRAFRPDVVVGDFRITLPVSAALAAVPCVTISNAYWSPYARFPIPCPDLGWTRHIDRRSADVLFSILRPAAFALHSRPMSAVRRHFGLPSLGHDLRRVYTHGDVTVYADAAELFPIDPLPSHHRYLGPVLWSPEVPLPAWWGSLPSDRPIVYVNLGSSGRASALPLVLNALSTLDVTVVAAAAGAPAPPSIPANAFLADYLPGDQVTRRASLVVCNGGAPASQQALAAGRPVLGLAGNLDQHLHVGGVERAGAGIGLHVETADRSEVRDAVATLLTSPYARRAEALSRSLAKYNAARDLSRIIDDLTSRSARVGTL